MKRIVIQFACTAKEKRAIQRAAKRAQMSVTRWLLLASKEADRRTRHQRMTTANAGYPPLTTAVRVGRKG